MFFYTLARNYVPSDVLITHTQHHTLLLTLVMITSNLTMHGKKIAAFCDSSMRKLSDEVIIIIQKMKMQNDV